VVDGQIYEIPVDTDDHTFLLVNLPALFPEEPPVITLSPTGMRHPWVEGDVIMHDALPSWTMQSNLGLLVKEIREEFIQRPPAKNYTSETKSNSEEG
jgi:ubiquitin-protein ligase